MNTKETCGAELAKDAEVPEKLGRLMAHVAQNLRVHAAWVGTQIAEAKLEHDALQQVAEGYEAISQAASRTAASMIALRDLPPAPLRARSIGERSCDGCTRRSRCSATWRGCCSSTRQARSRCSKADEQEQAEHQNRTSPRCGRWPRVTKRSAKLPAGRPQP